MSAEIKVFEFKTIEEAEAEYHLRISEGCWQMVKATKIVWSWKRFSHVIRFSMKKVEKPYTYQDWINDALSGINLGTDTYYNIVANKNRQTINSSSPK